MVRLLLGSLLALAAVAVASSAEPAVNPILDAPPSPTLSPLFDPQLAVAATAAPKREDGRIALDIGLPIGARVQCRLFDSNVWAEVGAGFWLVAPFASACVRYDCTLLRRQCNLFAVRPGVSATWVLNPLGAREVNSDLGLGLDAEVVWQHRFDGNGRTEVGFRVGATQVFQHPDADGLRSFTVPVVTLVFSWAF